MHTTTAKSNIDFPQDQRKNQSSWKSCAENLCCLRWSAQMSRNGLFANFTLISCRLDLDLNDQIEEVRELLYDIAKKSKTGVDSVLLAQEYDRQFVQSGIARPLPAAW
jgi:hypothetical protein